MSEYGKTRLTVASTTDSADPDAAIAWVRAQLAAALGTAGDEGWHTATMGIPRWQVAGVQGVRESGNARRG